MRQFKLSGVVELFETCNLWPLVGSFITLGGKFHKPRKWCILIINVESLWWWKGVDPEQLASSEASWSQSSLFFTRGHTNSSCPYHIAYMVFQNIALLCLLPKIFDITNYLDYRMLCLCCLAVFGQSNEPVYMSVGSQFDLLSSVCFSCTYSVLIKIRLLNLFASN